MKLIFFCRCQAGDRVGCGVKFEAVAKGLQASMVPVFFTRNGKEVPESLGKISLSYKFLGGNPVDPLSAWWPLSRNWAAARA